MKRSVALALTWDGARWPTRSLPPQASAFLAHAEVAPSTQKMATLLKDNQIKELRICWVPRLKGGGTLSEPFPLKARVAFRPTRMIPFGDILGVIYKR